MKRWFAVFVAVALVLSGVAWAEEKYNPGVNHTGVVGEAGKYWRLGGFDKFQMPEITAPSGNPSSNTGWVYIKDNGGLSALYFENDAGTVTDIGAASAATAWDDLAVPDANKTHAFTTFTSLFTGTSTVADQWTFSGTGNFGDVSVVRIESLTGNPTDGTVLEVVSHDTDADALLVTANAINSIQVAGSGALNLLGGVGTVTYTDWAFTADGLLSLAPDLGGTGITVTPSAALTTGLDVSNANITNGVSLGATKLLGTTAVIDFSNFDVSAAGAVTAVSLNAGTIKQDALVPASGAPFVITLDGAGAGGVTIGGTSTGTITLGGGSTYVNLPAATDLNLAGGQLSITDTANGNVVVATNNTLTSANGFSFTGNAQTTGIGFSYSNSGAVLSGSAFYAGITDGAGFTGYYFRGYDGAADDFAVKRYGATTIGGLASTDMLTVTAGDLQLTAGDIDVDLGILTIDNTADEANRIARNNAVGTAAVLEVEQTHATGGIGLLIDQKSTTAAHYGVNFTSAGATHEHFTANGAAGDVSLIDVTDAWTGQGIVIDAGPWLGTAGEGAGFSFASDAAATAEAGTAIKVLLRGTAADAAAIDGKGLFVEDNAAATAGSYLVKLDTQNNTALHISNGGVAADGIKFDVADSYTGQGIVADLGPWLGTSGEGFINITSDAAATVPAGQFIRMRQLGTGQHAAAIGGTLLFLEDDAVAPAAGTSYALYIDATNIEAIRVDTGKVLVDETVTATGGLSSGTAADSFIYTDTVELSNVNIKALRATPIALVAAPGADKFVELVSAVLILDYGTNVLTETADNLVIEYNTSGTDITGAIEATGFIDAAADTIKIAYPSITDVPAASAKNLAVQLFNTGDGEYAGNAGNDTTMTVKVNYRIHTLGL